MEGSAKRRRRHCARKPIRHHIEHPSRWTVKRRAKQLAAMDLSSSDDEYSVALEDNHAPAPDVPERTGYNSEDDTSNCCDMEDPGAKLESVDRQLHTTADTDKEGEAVTVATAAALTMLDDEHFLPDGTDQFPVRPSDISESGPGTGLNAENLYLTGNHGMVGSPCTSYITDEAGASDTELSSSSADDNSYDEVDKSELETDNEDERDFCDDHLNKESVFPEGPHDANKKIYEGAPITLAESVLAIITFSITHGLSGKCIADLLTLISHHCIAVNNIFKTSLYHLKKMFSFLQAPLTFHYICGQCLQVLESRDAVCRNAKAHKGSSANNICYFIEVPLFHQLQAFYKRSSFWQDLTHRFNRTKKDPSNIEDIYDGRLYESESKEGSFLSDPNNISLMWYTDGIPIFKSSKLSLWPIYFVINELSYKKRIKKENMLIGGLWFGQKPNGNIFLRPFLNSLKEFFVKGYCLSTGKGESICVKGKLLCGTCDAKCVFMNMTQFNGKHGCPSSSESHIISFLRKKHNTLKKYT